MAKKIFYNKKMIEQIKEQISILDVAKENGLTPVKRGDYYTLAEHDSVVIYPQTNSFFRHKNSRGGDVFAFADEFDIASFQEFYMKNIYKIDRSIEPSPDSRKPKTNVSITERKDVRFDINESLDKSQERERNLLSFSKEQIKIDNNTRNVKAFLIQTRKIDPEIVQEFIDKGLIKQGIDKYNHKVALFIGYNDVGYISAINIKSVNSRGGYKGDAYNCNYAFGWRYDPSIQDYSQLYRNEFYDTSKTLICFEGYVDMMAYISTLKEAGIDHTQYMFLTCGATSKYKSVVATCKSDLYNHVICAFDNDQAGDLHAFKLQEMLKSECGEDIIVERQKSLFKDWDEDRQYFSETGDRSIYSHVKNTFKIDEPQNQLHEKRAKKNIAKMCSEAKLKLQTETSRESMKTKKDIEISR